MCKTAESQLEIGESAVSSAVYEVCRKLVRSFSDQVSFPTVQEDTTQVMNGFKQIAGQPYCVGEIDGTPIPLVMCPTEQF